MVHQLSQNLLGLLGGLSKASSLERLQSLRGVWISGLSVGVYRRHARTLATGRRVRRLGEHVPNDRLEEINDDDWGYTLSA